MSTSLASSGLFQKIEATSDEDDDLKTRNKSRSAVAERAQTLFRTQNSEHAISFEEKTESYNGGWCDCNTSELWFSFTSTFGEEDEVKCTITSSSDESEADNESSKNNEKNDKTKKHKTRHTKKKKTLRRHHRPTHDDQSRKRNCDNEEDDDIIERTTEVVEAIDVEPVVLSQEARKLRKKRGSVLHTNEEEPNAEWELVDELMPVPDMRELQSAFFKRASHLAREGPFFATDHHGRTLLFLAVAKRDTTSIRLLLQVAQPNAPPNKFLAWLNKADESGITPLELANHRGMDDAARAISRRMKLARRSIRTSNLGISGDVGEKMKNTEIAKATNPVYGTISGVARRATTVILHPKAALLQDSKNNRHRRDTAQANLRNHIRNVPLKKIPAELK